MQGLLAEALQPLTAAAETAASSGNPESSPDAMLANLATPIAKLQSLLTGIAMTHAQVLLHRAPHVAAFAGQLKVALQPSHTATATTPVRNTVSYTGILDLYARVYQRKGRTGRCRPAV